MRSANDRSKEIVTMFMQNTTVVLERPRMCAMCNSTVAKRGSLCHTCADEIDRQMIEDNAIPNEPTCSVDGSVLNRLGHCDECVSREWKPVAR